MQGQDCSQGQGCVPGLVCTQQGTASTCQPLPGEGQPCSPFTSGCQPPYACVPDMPPGTGYHCAQAAKEGQPCATIGCDVGLYCNRQDPVNPICKPLLADGAACQQSSECQSGSCGPQLPGTCQPGQFCIGR
jgi:hypothetical protein